MRAPNKLFVSLRWLQQKRRTQRVRSAELSRTRKDARHSSGPFPVVLRVWGVVIASFLLCYLCYTIIDTHRCSQLRPPHVFSLQIVSSGLGVLACQLHRHCIALSILLDLPILTFFKPPPDDQLSELLFLESPQQLIASTFCQMQMTRHLLRTFLERMSRARVSCDDARGYMHVHNSRSHAATWLVGEVYAAAGVRNSQSAWESRDLLPEMGGLIT